MTKEFLWNFIIFWGIWLLIPMMLDGVIAAKHIIFSWRMLRKEQREDKDLSISYYPRVSIVVPVHNSEGTLHACLTSIFAQNYPRERIEVFLIDNGSSDDSFRVFNRFSNAHGGLCLRWVRIEEAGKAKALNSGVFLGNSEIIINLDSDAQIGPNVVLETVHAMFLNDQVAGATGAILIDHKQINKKSLGLRLLQHCELLEYLEAFFVGRKYQSHRNRLFTLAGAFSCFNRRSLLNTHLYDSNSISEDTKMTFELRMRNDQQKLIFMDKAKIYLEPISSWAKLYSQRVRWQRGELEVISSYTELYKGSVLKLIRSFASRMLFIDHTLMFPRIVWTVLTPLLVFVGYPLELILLANFFVYLMYLFIDANYLLVAYFYLDKEYRAYLREHCWVIIFMPVFRFIVFWFRVAAMIHAITEPAQWNAENPVAQTRRALRGLGKFVFRVLGRNKSSA